MSDEEQAREAAEVAVAEVVMAAVRAARDLYPEGSPEAIQLTARLLMARGAAAMKAAGEG